MAVFLLVCTQPGQAETVNEIVAVVNGEAVTRYELDNRMRGSFESPAVGPEGVPKKQDEDEQRRVLRSMINEILFRQEADRLGITVSDELARDRLERIRRSNDMSRDELEAYLQERGRDLEQFKRMIRRKIKVNRLLSSMVRQKVVVTEQEMRRYFEEHRKELLGPRKVKLSLILTGEEKGLKALRERIRQEELSFSEAAKRHSRGPNADEGGNLGEMNTKDLSRKVRDVVQGLEPGKMSRVFPFRNGYALVRLDQVGSGEEGDAFSRVRDEVRKEVYSRKVRQRYRDYVEKLRSKAVIEIRL